MTPSSSVPRVTGSAIDALPSRTCPAKVSSVSPGRDPRHVAVHDVRDVEAVEQLVEPGPPFDGPRGRREEPAAQRDHQAVDRIHDQSVGQQDRDDPEPGEEQPDEPAHARRGPQTGPRIAGPRPGQATDDPPAVEREGRDQVEQAEREVEGAHDERDVTDDQGRSLVVDHSRDRRDPQQGQADAEADDRTGDRDGDLVTRTGRRELGRCRGAEEVHDDRVGRDAPTAGHQPHAQARGPSPTRGTGSRQRTPIPHRTTIDEPGSARPIWAPTLTTRMARMMAHETWIRISTPASRPIGIVLIRAPRPSGSSPGPRRL